MFESLRPLSDSQIISGTKSARAQEHGGMLSLLGFLVETERRKIHLKLGYSSMFKYCTRALGHSESEAMLRITAARCVAGFPKVFALLESKDVNLSTVSRVAKILTPQNVDVVLQRIRGKSMREVEAIVAEYDPAAALPRDRVRTVVVRVPVAHASAVKPADAGSHLCNSGKISSSVETSTPEPTLENAELQLERRSIVQLRRRRVHGHARADQSSRVARAPSGHGDPGRAQDRDAVLHQAQAPGSSCVAPPGACPSEFGESTRLTSPRGVNESAPDPGRCA